MKPRTRYIATLLVAITTGLLFFAPTTHAIESYGIGAIPANPKPDNPRTKSIFVYQAESSQVINDGIKVINNSKDPRTMKVYPVDSERSSDGAFACAQAVQPKKDVGNWISLAKSEVTLAAGATETIPFTLTVPKNSDVGEHNGCIAIEESKPTTQSTSNGIVLSFRSALRVAVIVPGDIKANLTFTDITTNQKPNITVVSPTVKNTGNVSVDANLHIGIVDVFGNRVVGADGQYAVLTKDASRFNFELDSPFWGGWYHINASADYKPLNPDVSTNAKALADTATAQTRWIYVPPQPLATMIYTIAVVAIVGGLIYAILRRRHWKLMHLHTSSHTVVAGDNLQALAAKSGVSWKKLAKLNDLKPPYVVEPGQKIKLPDPAKRAQHKKHTHKG